MSCSVAEDARYTRAMERAGPLVLSLLLATVGSAVVDAASPVLLMGPDGVPRGPSDWLDEHDRTAVLVWASWIPGAEEVLADAEALRQVCVERGLRLLVVAVQEPVEASRSLLDSRDLPWLHDRHGALLKTYRVTRIPVLVLLEPDGTLIARLSPTAEEIRAWSPR